jgi:uncharacterized membrane protein YdjX (TVP38/TMEM64 family)
MIMNNLKNIFMRMLAVFAATGLSVIGAGSLFGLNALTAAAVAGTVGVATVLESLARSFLDDGKLSTAEINQAFAKVDKKKED